MEHEKWNTKCYWATVNSIPHNWFKFPITWYRTEAVYNFPVILFFFFFLYFILNCFWHFCEAVIFLMVGLRLHSHWHCDTADFISDLQLPKVVNNGSKDFPLTLKKNTKKKTYWYLLRHMLAVLWLSTKHLCLFLQSFFFFLYIYCVLNWKLWKMLYFQQMNI